MQCHAIRLAVVGELRPHGGQDQDAGIGRPSLIGLQQTAQHALKIFAILTARNDPEPRLIVEAAGRPAGSFQATQQFRLLDLTRLEAIGTPAVLAARQQRMVSVIEWHHNLIVFGQHTFTGDI